MRALISKIPASTATPPCRIPNQITNRIKPIPPSNRICNHESRKVCTCAILAYFSIYVKLNDMPQKEYKVAIWKEGRYFISQCLNVDVSTFGKTKKQALQHMEEALELYFEGADRSFYKKVHDPSVVSLTMQHAKTAAA